MDIAVLGPLEVNGSQERLTHRDRVVLSALVVAGHGRALTRDSLAEALWGEVVPPSHAKVVQGCVVRLRKLLGPPAIVTTDHGYVLHTHADSVDAHRFEQLGASARALLADGQPDRAAYLATQALALWRGRPLPDLDDWPPGRSEALRLEEIRLDVEDIETEAALRTGHHRQILAAALSRAAEAPLRERRWALLAMAQYQGGRQSDALLTLRRARTMLINEQGLDPSPELADLEAAVLRQDPQLAVGEPVLVSSELCPYPGLLPFGVQDANTFFGREAEVAACLERLDTAGVLAVVGPSGCGKSSLVRAGVAAVLTRDGRKVCVHSPGSRPLDTLDESLSGFGPTSAGSVLVVDQCEEALADGVDPQQRSQWVQRLVQHAEGGPVIIALRADRIGALSANPGLARLVERGLYVLGAMQESDLRSAIEGPARQAGLRLEPGLTDLLVHEVRGEPGALPLLSHALRQTWLRREGATLTVAGYHATGGVREALTQSADGLYERLLPAQRAMLRDLMLRLVSPSPDGEPIRTRVARRNVAADPARASLVEQLVAARLISADEETIEIAHEALAREWPRLRAWLGEDVEGQLIMRHLSVTSDSWDAMGRPPSELYRGPRLARALEWRATGPALSVVEEAFLEASEAAAASERQAAELQLVRERRTNRRLRVLLAVAGVLALAAAGSGAAATVSAQRARTQAVAADARRVAAEALTTPHPDTSLLLALAGMRLDAGSDSARAGLAAALDRWPQLTRVTTTPPAGGLAVDPTSGHVVLSLPGGGLSVYDGRTLALLGHSSVGGGQAVATSPDGTMVASCDMPPSQNDPPDTQPLRIYGAGGQPTTAQPGGIPSGDRCMLSLGFSGDGNRLVADLAGSYSGPSWSQSFVWDTHNLTKPLGMVPNSHVTTAALGRDGRTMYTTGDYYLRVFDVATGAQRAIRTGSQLGLQPLSFHDEAWTPPLAVSPDGNTLALVAGTEVGLLDPTTLTLKGKLNAPARVNRIAISSDSRRIAVAAGGAVLVWDVSGPPPVHVYPSPDGNSRRPVQVFRADTTGADVVGLSPNGDTVYAGGTNGQLLAWTLAGSWGFLTSHPAGPLHNQEIMARVSPDGRRIAYLANWQSQVEIRDVATGRVGPTLNPNGDNLGGQDIAWSPDGRSVIGVTGDYKVRAWDVQAAKLIADREVGQGVTAAQYSGDGTVLVGTTEGFLLFLDAKALAPRRTPIIVLNQTIDHLSVNTAEHTVFVDGATQHLVIDYLTGKRIASIPYAGTFSPDGKTIAVVDSHGAVGFLAAHDRTWIAHPDPTRAYGGGISAFSHNGSLFASSGDGHVGLWDAHTGSPIGSLSVSQPVSVGFSADDTHLVVAGLDGSVLAWDLRPDTWVANACTIAGREFSPQEWTAALPDQPYQKVCS